MVFLKMYKISCPTKESRVETRDGGGPYTGCCGEIFGKRGSVTTHDT